MKNKNGFTLVELLAVIAILAILVIIALPNVINMYNKAQKETFLTEAKKVYSEAEKKYISSSITGKTVKVINSKDDSKLDMTGEKLQYCVILNNNGKVTDMKVSNGKLVASLTDGKSVEDLTINDLKEGNLDDYECTSSQSNQSNSPKPIYCTYDGELVQGTEYINGQYTYRYMQEGYHNGMDRGNFAWGNMSVDGWGVRINTYNEDVTSKLCTYINNKPIVSTSLMTYKTNTKSIDLSSYNTDNVVNMSMMFEAYDADPVLNLDFSTFNTSKVTNMMGMFFRTKTSNLNLNSFDISNVVNMSNMFYETKATIGYAKDQATANKFNDSSVTGIPDTLKFTVK